MKKNLIAFTAAVIAGLLLFGCSKGYEKSTVTGDLTITLSVDRYPLVKGDNMLSVKAADASGKPVTDAAVSVRYFMPAMPGMAPMDFNTQAVLKGDQYALSANVPMEGGWKAEVSVTRPGKPAVTATFNIDAR
jgi:YtkA-like